MIGVLSNHSIPSPLSVWSLFSILKKRKRTSVVHDGSKWFLTFFFVCKGMETDEVCLIAFILKPLPSPISLPNNCFRCWAGYNVEGPKWIINFFHIFLMEPSLICLSTRGECTARWKNHTPRVNSLNKSDAIAAWQWPQRNPPIFLVQVAIATITYGQTRKRMVLVEPEPDLHPWTPSTTSPDRSTLIFLPNSKAASNRASTSSWNSPSTRSFSYQTG